MNLILAKKKKLFLILFSAIVYITREFSFVKIVILLTLNKSKKKKCWLFCWLYTSQKMLVTLLLWTSQKNVGYFADFKQHRPPLVTYPSLCSKCVTYGTLHHAIGYQLFPTHPFTTSAMNLREHFFTLRGFLPYTPSYFFQGFPGASSLTS